MPFHARLRRLRALELLDERAKQFRSRPGLWPFRVPSEPLAIESLLADAGVVSGGRLDPLALRSRTILRMDWDAGQDAWEAWVIGLPSGVSLYCDSGGGEARVLASARRNGSAETDRFFLELLGESRGRHFGIEVCAAVPDRVHTSVDDVSLVEDVFVELFEGTAAEPVIHDAVVGSDGGPRLPDGRDFRQEVSRWLAGTLTIPASALERPGRRRRRRLRDEEP